MMKQLRKQAEAAQSAKLRKMGAYGSMKDAKKAEDAPRKYASGGSVNMGPVDGGPAKPNLGRPGRKAGGAKGAKKGGTNVNVIVMPKPDGAAMPKAPADMPMPPTAAAGPMPPPGAGGPPPMPMRKSGGAVKAFKKGGVVKREDGGPVQNHMTKYFDDKRATERFRKIGSKIAAGVTGAAAVLDPEPVGKALAGTMAGLSALESRAAARAESAAKGGKRMWENSGLPATKEEGRKSGGKVSHDDVKEDKALIKSMVKSDAMKPGKRAKGGKI